MHFGLHNVYESLDGQVSMKYVNANEINNMIDYILKKTKLEI